MVRTTTLASHALEEERGVGAVIADVAAGVKAVSAVLARAAVCGAVRGAAGENVHGEPQREMDALANELLLDACVRGGHLAAVASEELREPQLVFGRHACPYLLAMDPLDGASNLCVNVTVGTVFSVLRQPEGVPLGAGSFLQPGSRQVCAGYALYGPCTMLVLTTGREVSGFTLDPAAGEFVLTHPAMRIPEESREFSINASNARDWERPVRRYVDECVAGSAGPRGADFNMRWVGSMVADVHRVLVRGGTFLYPRDAKDPARPAKLRLLYGASPMALLVEQAGGVASTGRERLLDVVPRALHERVPVVLGSRQEVERLVSYHADADEGLDRPYTSPLFNVRSLLRES
jgi:fructose-1,6-bisphosphatase I/sedoheptulose-1,7-bisphosphatase/fructose-1,6-bisphosphatase I